MKDGCNPKCKPTCEIPHATLDTRFASGGDQLRCLKGYYVHIVDEATVYHVDNSGNPIPISKMVVEKPFAVDTDPTTGKLAVTTPKYRRTFQFSGGENGAEMIYWDDNKKPWAIQLVDPLQEINL